MEVKIKGNNEVIATMGDILAIDQVQVYLRNSGINVPSDQLTLVYTKEEATAGRQQAYRVESDPLYLEWQYDRTKEKELLWRKMVEEIKARYPFPYASENKDIELESEKTIVGNTINTLKKISASINKRKK